MSKIVVITDSKDEHADSVIKHIPKKLLSRVNLDYFESTFLANFEFTKDFKVKINSSKINSFFLRRLFVDKMDIIRSKNLDTGFKNYISQQRNESFKNFILVFLTFSKLYHSYGLSAILLICFEAL